MRYDIEIRDILPFPLAAACGRANANTIGATIGELMSQVYEFLRNSTIEKPGHNVVLYHDSEEGGLFNTEDGIPIEVGVQVATTFEDDGAVVCSSTPGGRVAATLHMGAYQQLPEAHGAIRSWCSEHGHQIAGANWEIYGDWNDNPDELRTEVVYLLR